MPETKYTTVDILRDATVNGKTYTPQQRIVPANVATELVAQKAAVVIKPDTTSEELIEAEQKTVAAAEKLNK